MAQPSLPRQVSNPWAVQFESRLTGTLNTVFGKQDDFCGRASLRLGRNLQFETPIRSQNSIQCIWLYYKRQYSKNDNGRRSQPHSLESVHRASRSRFA
jgi:hypothetical protein